MGASGDLVSPASYLVSATLNVGASAFGVFFRLQVTDFDFFGFFSLCHFIFPVCYFGLFLVVLCQWHRRALDDRL